MKRWFSDRFEALCVQHDADYVARKKYKLQADFDMAKGMWKQGYKATSIATMLVLTTNPYAYWLWFTE